MPKQTNQQSIEPRLFRISEAAQYLSATPWFIRSLIWSNAIPFCRMGRRFLLDKADLDAFIAAQKEGAGR